MAKLDSDTWKLIYPWLEQAQDVPPSELAAWLDRLTAERPDVASPLREVLAQSQDVEEQGFLEQPYVFTPEKSRVGEVVGAYTIDSLLGRGGMGEVWLARRSDGRFAGLFAVKFLGLASASASAIERFRREGRLLARLTHPNIARLIDAGVTPNGQSYLVLEYVKGEHIDKYCRERALDLRERIRLFLDIIAAVAHAHTNLIVHRDIKPSNVLVTQEGSVKLLDFGVAKLISNDLADDDQSQPTRLEDVALTPDFAAPEQILGEQPSTATDVYQLGVLLYLLLVGRLPTDSAETNRATRIRAALDAVAPRPSLMAQGAARKLLRGDLDAIIGKALRKRPDERYATAAEMAADLERYLTNEPVKAREGAFAYRAGKFIRRYQAGVAGTAIAAVALIAVAIFALVQMREAEAQRDQSRALQKDAQAENQFLMQVMSTVSPDGKPVTPVQILDKGMALLEKQYANDPKFRVGMYTRMAARYSDIDDQNRAFAVLGKAEALAQQLNDPSALANIECSAVSSEVAMGHEDGAAQRLAQGRAALLRIASPTVLDRVRCMDAEASVLSMKGDVPGAIKLDESALAMLEQGGETADPTYDDLLSATGFYYNEMGNIKKSFGYTQRAIEHLAQSGWGESQNAATARANLAEQLAVFGQYVAALAAEEVAITQARSATSDGLVDAHTSMAYAVMQWRLGHPDLASTAFDAALAAAQRDKDTVIEALTRAERVDTLTTLKRYPEAHAELAKVQALAQGHEVPYKRATVHAQISEAELSAAEGRPADAHRQIDAVIDALRQSAHPSPVTTGLALLTAARIANADGRFAEAEQRATEALKVTSDNALDVNASADVGEALLLLAKAQQGLGRASESSASARRAVVPLTAGVGAEHALTRQAVELGGSGT